MSGRLTKSLVFITVVLGISLALYRRDQFDPEVWKNLIDGERSLVWLILCAALMPVNLGLEAWKWKYCLRHIVALSGWSAFKSMLTGLSLSFITPHGIGDYAGRILHLNEDQRLPAIGALLLCRLSQFYITLYVGTVALVYFIYFQLQTTEDQFWILVPIVICLNILMLGVFAYRDTVFTFLLSKLKWNWLSKILHPLMDFETNELARLFVIALFRHLVFCIQFSLLLFYMGVDTSWFVFFMGTSFVFLAKSIIPTIFDLGVREVSAVIFFGLFDSNHPGIIAASLLLWVINLLIPAFLGAFLVFGWHKISFTK